MQWSYLLQNQATVLDMSCGGGRYMHWFAQRGHAVTGIDKDLGPTQANNIYPDTLVCANIENDPWLLYKGEYPISTKFFASRRTTFTLSTLAKMRI